jgi:hypothetical protein
MSIEHFTVQPVLPAVLKIVVVILVVSGIVLLTVNLLLRNRLKTLPVYGMVGIAAGLRSKYIMAIIGIMLIIFGGIFVYVIAGQQTTSVVTVGDGYINVESPCFVSLGTLLGVKGNKNVTSKEIDTASVRQIGSGNFNLQKQSGTNFDDTNVGRFTLGNGATAYVATTNTTSLIIRLNNGEYLILGTADTQALADSFAQNVHPLTS